MPITIVLDRELVIHDATPSLLVDIFPNQQTDTINQPLVDLLLQNKNIYARDFIEKLQSTDQSFPKKTYINIIDSKIRYDITISHFVISKIPYYILSLLPFEKNSYNELKAYINAIINNLPGAVYWKDKEGQYIGCNRFVANMAGFDNPEQIIGKTDYDLCWSEFADDWRKLDQEIMHAGKTIIREEKAKLSDGRVITELTYKTPLLNEYGEIVGIIGTSLDISDKKLLEEQLIAAKEKAEVANKLKTEFIENMQHDLRTPASGIYGALEMLINAQDHQQNLEILPIIAKSAKELLAVCNEVIDFEHPEYGRDVIQSKELNIHDIAGHILNLNNTTANDKGIQLQLEIDNNVPKIVQGDSYRIKKILTNLIGNSLKFTKTGEVKLAIQLVDKNHDAVSLQFEISDTGIGIPEDKIDLIFEKFIRLNPSNQGLYKGTGLGLSFVKKFVDELGGSIEVKSKLNVGTQFFITLSFSVPAKELAQQSVSQLKPSANATQKINHILIIEDNLLGCMVVKKVFEKLNCAVTTASNVDEALKILNIEKFDLVVSDLGLPDGTGFDIICFTKQNTAFINNKTPFVALTAHNDEEKKLKCAQAGFLEMLSKPIQSETAQKILRSYTTTNQPSLTESAQDTQPSCDSEIFDFPATKSRLGASSNEFVLEMLTTCMKSLETDRLLLEKAYEKNDILETRNLLHKIEGGFCYISAPRLHKALLTLHDKTRHTSELISLKSTYHTVYQEIDNFLAEGIKIKGRQ